MVKVIRKLYSSRFPSPSHGKGTMEREIIQDLVGNLRYFSYLYI